MAKTGEQRGAGRNPCSMVIAGVLLAAVSATVLRGRRRRPRS